MTYSYNLSPLQFQSLRIGDIVLDIPGGNIEQIRIIKIAAIDYSVRNRQQEVKRIIDCNGDSWTYERLLAAYYDRR